MAARKSGKPPPQTSQRQPASSVSKKVSNAPRKKDDDQPIADKRKFSTNVNRYKRNPGLTIREHKRRPPLPKDKRAPKKGPAQQAQDKEDEEEEQEEPEGEVRDDNEEYDENELEDEDVDGDDDEEEEEEEEEDPEGYDSIDEILENRPAAPAPTTTTTTGNNGNDPTKLAKPKLTIEQFLHMAIEDQQDWMIQDRVGDDPEMQALVAKDAASQGKDALYNRNKPGARRGQQQSIQNETEQLEDDDGGGGKQPAMQPYDNDRGRGTSRLSTKSFIEVLEDNLRAEPNNHDLRSVIDHAQRGRYKPGSDYGPNCIIPHLQSAGQYRIAQDVMANVFDFSK